MKLPTLAAVVLLAFLTACQSTQDGHASGYDLSTSETQFYSSQRLLPLPVATKPGETLHVSEIWGIQILEILADGFPVVGETYYGLLDDPNIGPVTVQSDAFIYTIYFDQLLFGKWSKYSYSLVEYSIPEDVKSLEIIYRLVPYQDPPEDSKPDPHIYILKARRIGN